MLSCSKVCAGWCVILFVIWSSSDKAGMGRDGSSELAFCGGSGRAMGMDALAGILGCLSPFGCFLLPLELCVLSLASCFSK